MDDKVLADVKRLLSTIEHGKAFVTLANNNGTTVSAHVTYQKSVGKYESNRKAKEAIDELIAEYDRDGKTGTIALSLSIQKGKVRQIMVQPTDRITIR